MSQHRPLPMSSNDSALMRESEAGMICGGASQYLEVPRRPGHRTGDPFSSTTSSSPSTSSTPVTPFTAFSTPNSSPSPCGSSKDSPLYSLAPEFVHSLDDQSLDDTQYAEVLPFRETSPLRSLSDVGSGATLVPGSLRRSNAHIVAHKKRRFSWYHYEQPRYWLMSIHTGMCIAGFPIVYFLPKAIGEGLSLFWARVVVGAISSLVGLSLGVTLLYLGRRGIEAAVWATIAHATTTATGGLSLKEVAFQVNPGPLSALILLFRRLKSDTRTGARQDPTYWSLVILLFLVTSVIAASSTFFLGRTVDIGTLDHKQREDYIEVTVAGEHSPDDIRRATELAGVYEDFSQTWTLGTFSSSNQLPMPIQLKYENPQTMRNESVYFSDTFSSQLEVGGVGFGTFDTNHSSKTANRGITDARLRSKDTVQSSGGNGGRVMRWPRWGIRIECARVPDLERNVVLSRNSTIMYTFIPRSVLSPLFDSLGVPWPAEILNVPINETVLWQFEQPPGQRPAEVSPDLDLSKIAGYGFGTFWDTGLGHSFKSAPLTMGKEGYGWRQIETALVRHNTSLCPQASFGRVIEDVVNSAPEGGTFNMGVDVGVCLEVIEPYIVEAYTASGVNPVTTAVVGKGSSVDEGGALAGGKKLGSSLGALDFSRALNSSGKAKLWEVVHDNSRNIFLKDNGRDDRYAPSPSSVSFTLGHGPKGYTSLDGGALAHSFAIQDSTNLLPYLAGSQPLLARSYGDVTLATVRPSETYLSIALFVIWAFGMITAVYVPKLPFGESRRDFSPVTWLVTLGLGEDGERETDLVREARRRGARKRMTLGQLERRLGDLKLR